jgi:hypothetical protein
MDCKEAPAGTVVGAAALPGFGTRAEIEVVAFVPLCRGLMIRFTGLDGTVHRGLPRELRDP